MKRDLIKRSAAIMAVLALLLVWASLLVPEKALSQKQNFPGTGIGGTPAGPVNSLQFNNGGAFGGGSWNYLDAAPGPVLTNCESGACVSPIQPGEIRIEGNPGTGTNTFITLVNNVQAYFKMFSSGSNTDPGAIFSQATGVNGPGGQANYAGDFIARGGGTNTNYGVIGSIQGISAAGAGTNHYGITGDAIFPLAGGNPAEVVLLHAQARGQLPGGTIHIGNFYGVQVEDLGAGPAFANDALFSDTEQAAIKIEPQTLARAAGLKFAIHVAAGAGNSQFDSPVITASMQGTTSAFASLPACAAGTEGTQRPVTDSTVNTWGTAIVGGGANHVLAYCDGTSWTVYAK